MEKKNVFNEMDLEEAAETTESRFRDEVGNYLMAAVLIRKEESFLIKAKADFYQALEKFMNSGFKPTEKINEESLEVFFEYKNKDWSDPVVMKELRQYFSLIS